MPRKTAAKKTAAKVDDTVEATGAPEPEQSKAKPASSAIPAALLTGSTFATRAKARKNVQS